MEQNIFLQISILLGLTVSIAFIMRLLRQPLIVAYIVAGLVAGPLFLNIVDGEASFFTALAQFGIVLLLFIVGLTFNPEYIRRVGRYVLWGGVVQFVVTAAVGYLLMRLFGFEPASAIFVSVAITFSSTIIVVKLLADKKDVETVYGQYVIGLLIVQDVIAVTLLILLNTFAEGGAWYSALTLTLVKGVLIGAVIYLLSRYLLPPLINRVASSSELLFIFTIAWCFGVASLVYAAGLGVEIGAVFAGMSLGSSPYQAEISSRLRPLRDFFIILFFVVLGSELQLGDIVSVIGPGVVLSAFVLVVQPIILYIVMRRMGYRRRSAFLAGVTAAQVSEFGFILIFKGQELGYLFGPELALLTLTALITIVVSSYLITYNEQVYESLRPLLNTLGKEDPEVTVAKTEYPVWVFGYHRIGWKVCEELKREKIRFAVVDFNPLAIRKLERRGIPAYFGDAADVEFLEGLGLEKAKLIISTLPEFDDQKILVRFVRRLSGRPLIICNLQHSRFLPELYEAGANYVMLPHLLGGQWISDVLRRLSWTRATFVRLRRVQHEEMKLRYTVAAH